MTNGEKLAFSILELASYDHAYSGVEWKTQDSTSSSILFYYFREKNELEVSKFLERMKTCDYAKCIVNFNFDHTLENIEHLSEKDYFTLKLYLLDYYHPIREGLEFVGVTGTNGKTTTVDLVRQMAVYKKKNILTIGTLGVLKNNEEIENFSLTTPSLIDFRKIIHKVQNDIDFVAMELSSIALEQKRVDELQFKAIGWTNFTQDHLDYHQTMEKYFSAKMLIYNHLENGTKVLIPETQKELMERVSKTHQVQKCSLPVVDQPFFRLSYNQENLAIALGLYKSATGDEFTELEILTPPPGRANIVENGEQVIVVDYAHTPDGIISIAKNLKNSFQDKKLVTLFGCGGDRDRSKRSLMAQAAQSNSDYVVLTSDNPRFEDPQQILDDAKLGLGKESEIILDRKDAIKTTLNKFSDAVILIAGKGHEDYLDIQGVKHPYNDMDWVKEIISD